MIDFWGVEIVQKTYKNSILQEKNACQSIYIVYLKFCQDDLLKLNEDFVNHRIESHASRINTMEYPTYQEIMIV